MTELELITRRIQDALNETIAEIKARLDSIETRLTDLERRMHISPELMRDLEKGSNEPR